MLQESPVIPHSLAEVLRLLLAGSIAWLGGWLARRRREPIELRKLQAETRSLDVSSDISLMNAATEALTKALRVVDERNHWERRCGDLLQEVGQYEEQSKLDELQLRKMTTHRDMLRTILDEKQISYPDWDGKWPR